MNVKAFITHKLSEDYSSCQDYFSINGESRAICLSDGMSQSIFPDYWAKIVSQHVANTFEFSEDSRINKLCPQWNEKVLEYIDKEKKEGRNPWRLESNLEEGISAGCTICAVRFHSGAADRIENGVVYIGENCNRWDGIVLGDSCIVAVHWDSNSLEIFSSEDKEFDSYPDYVDSNPKNKGKGKVREFSGRLDENTTLLLVSDPFSEYLNKHSDNSIQLVKELVNLQTHDEFVALVARWRENGMHNDDSTLIVVNYDNQDTLSVKAADSLETFIKEESEPNRGGGTELQDNDNLPIIAIEESVAEQESTQKDEQEEKNEELDEPITVEKPETEDNQTDSEGVIDENENDTLPISGNVIDIQFLKDKSEDVVEKFLDSQKARSLTDMVEWLIGWRQQVKATLMKYNEFILSIEVTENNDTDTSS